MGLYYKHEHSVKRNDHRLLSESHDVKNNILWVKYNFFNVKRYHCALKKVFVAWTSRTRFQLRVYSSLDRSKRQIKLYEVHWLLSWLVGQSLSSDVFQIHVGRTLYHVPHFISICSGLTLPPTALHNNSNLDKIKRQQSNWLNMEFYKSASIPETAWSSIHSLLTCLTMKAY